MVYIRANGLILNIEVRGKGEPVVLISDLGDDLTSWCFQTSVFGSLHFLLRVDNRGSGWSDCPESCTIEDMARDILSLMDLVGVERSHLVGLGMGGMVAQEIALNRPARVNGLVLAATSARPTDQVVMLWQRTIDAARDGAEMLELGASILPWTFAPWFMENDRWRAYLTRAKAAGLRSTSWDGAERQLDGMMRYSSLDRLGDIRSPTLVLSGAHDLLFPSSCANELAAGIRGARNEVLSTGHQPHIELPRSFNQSVIGFLAEVEGGAIPDLGPGMPLPCGFGL